MSTTGNLLEAPRFGGEASQLSVVMDRFVVEEGEPLDTGSLTKLDTDNVARVSPVRLDRNGFGQRVHGIEHDQIGLVEKLAEFFMFGRVVQRVLGIG